MSSKRNFVRDFETQTERLGKGLIQDFESRIDCSDVTFLNELAESERSLLEGEIELEVVSLLEGRRARNVEESFGFVSESGLLETKLLVDEFDEGSECLGATEFVGLEGDGTSDTTWSVVE